MALTDLLKSKSIRIPVFEHALPHRILFEELEVQGRQGSPETLNEVMEAFGQLEAAKNALDDWSSAQPGLPAKDSNQEREQAEKLENVRLAEENCRTCEQKITDMLHAADRSALCFSGGGIRSASIGLGVLQGLALFSMRGPAARPGILHKLSFLSTVSGGGYIGSWFMAWARRNPLGYAGVISEISRSRVAGVDPEPRPVRHLRKYTSYLAPRLGGLTVDTWTLAATVVRNLFLNNCMLLPGFAALLCVPILIGSGMKWLSGWSPDIIWLGGFSLTLLVALFLLAFVQSVSKEWKWEERARALLFLSNGLVSLIVAGLVVYWIANHKHPQGLPFDAGTFLSFAGLIAIPLLVPAIHGCRLVIRKGGLAWWGLRQCGFFVLAVPAVALATAALLLLLARMACAIETELNNAPAFAAKLGGQDLWWGDASIYVLGPPLVWAILLTATSLFTGIVAKADPEENREWWARMKAIHMLLMLGWFGVSLVAFYGPVLFDWVIGLLALGAGSISAFLGKSPTTPAKAGQVVKSNLTVVASVLGLLFMLLLAITLTYINRRVVDMIESNEPGTWAIWFALLLGFAFFCNLFFSVNTFSLHGMYRSRLIRAYLGASNEFRSPDFFTNFDSNDNLLESDLLKTGTAPLHIINATLNLVATTNTAWTQRKAESFTFSPLHCGSFRVGYVPTGSYAGRGGLTLGTAMAISGAAFNPNMGYHSSPLLTLIMTLFNVRLGCWLPNPRLEKGERFFRHTAPRLALLPLVSEAMGNTNDKGYFIQVSDGGHFENLGLYEMVMRRCHRIIVVDGGADPKFELEDLGNAIRKIRIDFGIQINFRNENRIQTGNNSQAIYCAIADIHYTEIDGPHATDGVLIYLKPAVRGSESIDVQHYGASHQDFPNETTADQFFNEAQFESYRKLGITMVQEIMSCSPRTACTTEEFFTAAEQYTMAAVLRPRSVEDVVGEADTFLASGKMRVTIVR